MLREQESEQELPKWKVLDWDRRTRSFRLNWNCQSLLHHHHLSIQAW